MVGWTQVYSQRLTERERLAGHRCWLDTGVLTKADGERTVGWTQVYSQRLTERERLAGHRCTHKG